MTRKICIIILSIHTFIFFGAIFSFGIPEIGFDIGTLFFISSLLLLLEFIIILFFITNKNDCDDRFINIIYYIPFIHLILHTILLMNIAG
jgi:hypothetical protein